VWALVPWLNAGANLLLETGARSALWDQSRVVVVLNYAALSLAMVLTRQMRAVKETEVALARELYAQAYEPRPGL
jgi:hypothetical protein